MTIAPLNLLDSPPSQWRELLVETVGVPAYRGDQIAAWVYGRAVYDPAAMTDLPVELRSSLPSTWVATPPSVHRAYASVDGSRRFLLQLEGDVVEAVSMPVGHRTTFCISSQIGCRFACTFCQTGTMGLVRSLSPGEIVGQVLALRDETTSGRGRVNVVFMGQGEPLDNAESVIRACEIMQDPKGLDMSWRRITVSTVGLVPAILRLEEMGPRRPRLAVSLNAATDELRAEIMPVNRRYPIADLLGALRRIRWRSRERVTLEYVLLAGVNDRPEDARRLASLLHRLPAKVNLIPWNPIGTMPYRRPAPEAVEQFRRAALAHGLDALVRYSRGADIGAACGQLQAENRAAPGC